MPSLGQDTLICGERTTGTDECGLYVVSAGELHRIGTHDGSVTGLEPLDGPLVLSAGRDQRVALWDSAARRCVAERTYEFWARGLRVSPNRRHAALSHSGVAVIDLPGLNLFQDADDAFAGVARAVCFSPDGRAVVAEKVNGQVIALPLDGERRRRARQVAMGHGSEITGLAALPGRSALVSGSAHGRIEFTAWPQGIGIGATKAAGARLTSLHISADEAFMVTGDADERIAFWDIRGLELPVLLSRPLADATPTHLAVLAAFQQEKDLPNEARRALRFLEVLLRHRFRYDVELAEVGSIKAGEFDIEIEG